MAHAARSHEGVDRQHEESCSIFLGIRISGSYPYRMLQCEIEQPEVQVYGRIGCPSLTKCCPPPSPDATVLALGAPGQGTSMCPHHWPTVAGLRLACPLV